MMPAGIEESAQHSIRSPNDNYRLSCYVAGDILSRLTHLIDTTCEMPRMREDCLKFKVVEILIRIPRGRNGQRFFKRSFRIIAVDDFPKFHGQSCQNADRWEPSQICGEKLITRTLQVPMICRSGRWILSPLLR